MITYEPLWVTMQEKRITKYFLKTYCEVNNNTIYRLNNNQALSTNTINRLCEILDCRVEDIMCYKKEDCYQAAEQ